jgi:DNA (cytosine-5)-methyltransferase 1
MKHLGDITHIHGDKIPPVDIITGGSPCQDLSVAGKRAGLEGERSGLFMEQIRIVKEMRNATGADVDIRLAKPRFMVWENVPGAFSSNGGADFQAVLTEIVRIAEPDAPDVPLPDKGKWDKSGCIYDDLGRWSVAWRVHDAQFWGVPQRRKRIALVADFAGLSAAEVLFERKGMSWNSESRIKTRQGAAGDSEDGIGESD